MKNIVTSTIFLSLIVLFTSCSKKEEKQLTELPAIPAIVKEISNSESKNFVSASGRIEAENSANISTRMMGYITSIVVKTGQNVRKGQLLATINNTDLHAKKAQAEAGISQANAAYLNAKKDYDRYQALFAQKSATQKELDDMTTRLDMTKAGLETANQMKNEVMAQFSYANITAPFSGVITGTFLKEGDMANPGMPIVSMEGISKLQAVVMISEGDILNIKKGTTADVTIKSINKTLQGKVAEISLSARNTGGQYTVKIDLEKPEDILSGMFVNANISVDKTQEIAQSDLLLIPQEAVIKQGQLKGIYVVNSDNIAVLRWLRLGKVYGNDIEVLSGLTSNEKYIVSADGRLFNGAKITIQ